MKILDWPSLDASARRAALARPAMSSSAVVVEQARAIITAVRREGDAAVLRYEREFGGAQTNLQPSATQLRVSSAEIAAARAALPTEAVQALRVAIANVTAFHRAQVPQDFSLEIQPGVHCERVVRPLSSVGLYVPAGSAPLPSTAIMLAIPAGIAGCRHPILCTPAGADGRADAAVLVAAQMCGIEQIYKVGGAQAIAAMAYGTASIPKVVKIFGPGNRWVTAAKQLVAADPDGAALDMPAGPSEVMVIADEGADADFVATDMLAQSEHDTAAQAILVSTSFDFAQQVADHVARRLPHLSRRTILHASLLNARLLVVPDLPTAVQVAELYAPEHLLIQTRAPRELLAHITTAGSVFLGPWSPEPLGDYCSGTNHVLPTYGYARAYSGLSVIDFVRTMTVQELTADGLAALGPVAATLARLEGLDAHAAAVEVRLGGRRSS